MKIVTTPKGVAKGWDAANAEAEGWDRGRAMALLKAAVTPEEFQAMHQVGEQKNISPPSPGDKPRGDVRHSQPGPGGQEWPEPRPLSAPPQVMPFDFALLPGTLRPLAVDVCERLQCPPDYFAVGAITALGSVIGRQVAMRPEALSAWTIVCNLWCIVVGRPGSLKSPTLNEALAFLRMLVSWATAIYLQNMKNFKAEAAAHKLREEARHRTARNRLSTNQDADVSELVSCEGPEEPVLRRYIVNDTTAPALGELLRQNTNGVLVYRDELIGLLKHLSKEDQAEARSFYLSAWNGNESYTFDRIGRGFNLHIPAVCLSVLGSTTPGMLLEYVNQALKGGANDDGLLQRFGMMVWPETNTAWRQVDRPQNEEAYNKALAVFTSLAKIDLAEIGANQDMRSGEPHGLPYLRFSEGGLEVFRSWRADLESLLRGDTLSPALESHFSKYRKLAPSLALILHLAGGGRGPVTEMATLQALAWIDYLQSHARKIYGMAKPESTAATALLDRIQKGELPDGFTAREVYRRGWAHLGDHDEVDAALDVLIDHNFLREDQRKTGGRPTNVYHINPKGALL